MSEDLLVQIYNAFDPKRPLEPDSPFYVDCHAVRGQENIIKEVGRSIVLANEPIYQLYTGHRGVGKSTELRRLRRYLEQNDRKVIYFEATDDIDEIDVQYTDILLSCTRHLLEDLWHYADPKPLVNWLRSGWEYSTDLASAKIDFSGLRQAEQISMFTKLTALLRQAPSIRQKIRDQLDLQMESLIKTLNYFIVEAQQSSGKELVLIIDNLDRIGLVSYGNDKTNHDRIFLDHSMELGQLACNVIYTVPISLVYSNRASQLRAIYGNCSVLPMVMVRSPNGTIHQPGLDKMKQLVQQRVGQFTDKALVPEVFESNAVLESLCLASGGHMRELMQLVQTALNWTEQLPIQRQAMLRAVAKGRDDYRNAVDEVDWERLAAVAQTKRIPNEDDYRGLLFNRCVLEYRMMEETEDDFRAVLWHDVHPLIQKLEPFQRAVERLQKSNVPPPIYRFSLSGSSSDEDVQNKLAIMQENNPDWKFVPDKPKPGESKAFLAIHKDVDERIYQGVYIIERTLTEIFDQLL
ncbi:MAG: ATP-binding protein [Cyanothece sp. SIO2G6]|nr:ATP-binding protein [Cyanothece sp. SIO2G6]